MLPVRKDGRPLRIGHRGAAALAPENTLAALAAAIDAGADAVEFDVLAARGGLLLAHSADEMPADAATLDEALAFLAGSEVGLHVDVKGEGSEAAIAEALRRHGLLERAFVSSVSARCLRAFAAAAPGLPRALTYPEDRFGVSRLPGAAPVVSLALAAGRRLLPLRLAHLLRGAQANVASLNERVVTAAVVARCRSLGVPIVVWTVDDPERIRELAALGVDAIVADDPRLLAATIPT